MSFLEEKTPPPLEFFTREYIHPSNKAVVEKSESFTYLGLFKRWRLWRYVSGLQRNLQRRGWNTMIQRRDALWAEYAALRAKYESGQRDQETIKRLKAIIAEGRKLVKALQELAEDHARYQHYRSWLEYERANRKRLKSEARREKQIRKSMRMESKWIEDLLLDVFRKTKGCHHIYSEGGKEITKIPRFERCIITADAHWFYLAASRKVLWWYQWKLPYGVNIPNLTDEATIANMKAATKRDVKAVWNNTGQLIYRVARLDSPDALPRMIFWRDTIDMFPEDKAGKLPYCIGVKEGRRLQWFSFADEPHALVAGKSQSGKSNLINGIIATLVSKRSPDQLRIVLIDQKGGIEFSHWKELPHLLWEVAKTVDDVIPYLTRLVQIMKRRMARLESARAKDLDAYNARVDKSEQLPRILTVIDELNTFVGLGEKTEQIHNLIMLIASQGRAVGMHLILSTQHPEVKVVPGRIKTNMGARLSGAMPSVSASQIILDQPDAANLPNIPGRFVAVSGMQTYVVQVPRIEDRDIAMVVSSARQKWRDVPEELPEVAEHEAKRPVVWDEYRVAKACIEWLNGALSGEKLHKMLGDESPGERHLRYMCKRVIDRNTVEGFVTFDGVDYTIKRVKRAYVLKPLNPDDRDERPKAEPLSEKSK